MKACFRSSLVLLASLSLATESPENYPTALSGGAPCGSCDEPANLSWKTVIPPENEPGERLIITGKVFQPDGKTPAQGMVLWVYHTDRTGFYNEKDDASHPRLKGWMKIGADGNYEFHTIRPGAYPHRTTPAHIHAHVYGPGYSERSIEDYWFKDDSRINEKELKNAAANGGHPVIVELKRGSDGVWRGERDITVKPRGKQGTAVYKPPAAKAAAPWVLNSLPNHLPGARIAR